MDIRPFFRAAAVSALLSAALPCFSTAPGEIALGGEIVMRLRVPVGKMTLGQREDMVQERIIDTLSVTDLTGDDVIVFPTAYGPTIYVRGAKLITVDKETAAAAGVTQNELARQWADRLAIVLPMCNVRLPEAAPVHPPAPEPSIATPAPAQPTPSSAP